MPTEFQDRITVNPKVMAGKPVIRGTRIPVDLFVHMVAQGIPMDEILEDYPGLQAEDIQAALEFDSLNSTLVAIAFPDLIDIARKAGLTYLAVFGSTSRGEAGPTSDVDLAVRFGRRMTLFELADLQMRFQDILQRPVDLVPVDSVYPFMRESLDRDRIVLLDTATEAVGFCQKGDHLANYQANKETRYVENRPSASPCAAPQPPPCL